MTKLKQIPVNIITGFLGSGKTTLLNEIISLNPEKKFAIIENEFGEIPIDNDLVIGADDGIYEFSNGCICCSLNSDLVNIFMKLARKAKKIDRILIETTGIADPAPILLSLMKNPLLYSFFTIDSVICVVDAKNFEKEYRVSSEAKKQIAYADSIILNKVSITAPAKFNSVYESLQEINPDAAIIETNFCAIDPEQLFGKYSFSLKKIEEELNQKEFHETTHSHEHHGGAKELNHTHSHNVNSVSFEFPGVIDENLFVDWINTILTFKGEDIYRGKGILNVNKYNSRIIFQVVQQDFLSNTGKKWEKGERMNKLVFIGKNLDKKMFEAGVRSTVIY